MKKIWYKIKDSFDPVYIILILVMLALSYSIYYFVSEHNSKYVIGVCLQQEKYDPIYKVIQVGEHGVLTNVVKSDYKGTFETGYISELTWLRGHNKVKCP